MPTRLVRQAGFFASVVSVGRVLPGPGRGHVVRRARQGVVGRGAPPWVASGGVGGIAWCRCVQEHPWRVRAHRVHLPACAHTSANTCQRTAPCYVSMKKAPADPVCRGLWAWIPGAGGQPREEAWRTPRTCYFFSLAIESCRAFSGSSAAAGAEDASPAGADAAPSMPAVGSMASGAPAASGMVASISMRTLSRS